MKINAALLNLLLENEDTGSNKSDEINVSLFKKGGKAIKLSKKGGKSGIHIKKSHEGLFTDYCNGKVTSECIQKGKNSSDPKIRKRATFAANARKWNH